MVNSDHSWISIHLQYLTWNLIIPNKKHCAPLLLLLKITEVNITYLSSAFLRLNSLISKDYLITAGCFYLVFFFFFFPELHITYRIGMLWIISKIFVTAQSYSGPFHGWFVNPGFLVLNSCLISCNLFFFKELQFANYM